MMKRFCILTFLLAMVTGSMFASKVPAGGTVYLDVTKHWCCKASYLIYFSSGGGYYVKMEPVSGQDGIYKYTATTAFPQGNIRFCYADTKNPTLSGWQGYTCTSDESGWTAAAPYFVVDDEGGSGHWASTPSVSGPTELGNVTVDVSGMSCIDSTYSVDISVEFTGAPCGLKVESDLLKSPRIKQGPESPYSYTIKGIKEAGNIKHNINVILYNDGELSNAIATHSETFFSPIPECIETHDITICNGNSIVLRAGVDGDNYLWNTGEETRELALTPKESGTYSVRTFSTALSVVNNLMANGDFESDPPTGFESDYNYYGFDPANIYSGSGAGKSGLYVISSSAKRTASSYADVTPHSGDYFALFDSDKKGDAWRATTKDNPSLVLIKDSTYVFSYWAADINTSKEQGHPAKLQFKITYDGVSEDLGTAFSPSKDNEWCYQEVVYKAKANSQNVSISVHNQTEFYGVGNDFGLDDIMFQLTTSGRKQLAKTDVFNLEVRECAQNSDTVCPGDHYTGYGYDVTYDKPGVYQLYSGSDSVDLIVIEPPMLSMILPSGLCDATGSIEVPYKIEKGHPSVYSMTFNDQRFQPIKETSMPYKEFSIPLPEGADGKVEVMLTVTERTGHCSTTIPFTLDLTEGIGIYAKWNNVLFVDNHEDLYTAYQWYENGDMLEGETNQYLYRDEALTGSYYVILTGKDGSQMRSCEQSFDEARRSAELNPGTDKPEPIVYPNPVRRRGKVNIGNIEDNCTIEVYNLLGTLVMRQTTNSFDATLPVGIYQMLILGQDSTSTLQLIVR